MIRRVTTCLLLLCMGVLADAATPYVTGLYEPIVGGYRLYFTLHNTLEGEAVWAWYVHTADVSNPFGPTDWNVMQTSRDLQWSTDWKKPWDRLPPGQSLSGFGYTAASQPTVLGYFIGGESYGYGGGTVTMILIPEPSSLLALGGGLLGLGLLRRRSKQ